MENKKIRLHPFKNGKEDKDVNLYPETNIESVVGLQQALDNKQGELTPAEQSAVDSGITQEKVAQYDGYANEIAGKQDTISDLETIRSGAEAGASAVQPNELEEELENYLSKEDYLENAKYDKVEKEIPGEIVDGETYTLPKAYDLTSFDCDWDFDNLDCYEEESLSIQLITNIPGNKGVEVEDKVNQIFYYYMSFTNGECWYYYQEGMQQPLIYNEDINAVINLSNIIEGNENILKEILNITPQIIEIDRTVKQKNEDIKNWTYDRKEHKEMVYGFQEGVNYKVNFNGNDYLNKFNDFTPYPDTNYIYGYNGDETLDYNCSIYPQNGMYFGTLRFVINGNYYWFIVDPTNDEKLGTWRKGNGYGNEEYTDEELANVTFVLDESVVSQDYIEYLKEVVLDLNGEPVEELVNGQTYKINFNVKDYLDIFDWYADNGKNDIFNWYLYGTNTVGVDSICFYSGGYLNGLYISLNGYYYYMCPHIGKYFPCRWYRSSDIRNSNAYSSQDLQNVNLTMIRKAIVNEELLRAITTNIDGTPITEDHEETIIEIKKVDDIINAPLKDKVYEVVEVEKVIPNELEDDTDYYFKENMEINLQTMQEYFKNLESEDYIYNNEDNGECIQYIVDTPSGKVDYAYTRLRYTDSSSNSYDYIIANIMSLTPTFINEWEGGSLDFPITIYTEYIMNEDILKLMLNLGTHTEIEYKNQTLEEKNADLPNWMYEYKLGFFDVPKWDKIPDDFWGYVYEDETNRIAIQVDTETTPRSIRFYNTPTNEMYEIIDIDYTWGNISLKGNTWYKSDISSYNSQPVECETPQIVLDNQYINNEYIDIFKAIYGENKKTLKQKFDEIEEKINNVEPLKDKIYSNSGDLVDGEEYKLKEDYTEFFDKYAHGQSTLIYGENDSPTPSPTPILADGVTAKGGDSIDLPAPDIEVPTNNPTILGIYLYTDSTPIIKDGLTRDGAIQYDGDLPAPDIPVFGGASIDVYTNQGTITFNQGGDGWYYDGNKIPTEQLPTLILDSSLIQNEEMLKDFIGGSSITLEQKFDEVEAKFDEPLKDKLYEDKTITDEEFIEGNTYVMNDTNEEGNYYDIENGVHNIYPDNTDSDYTIYLNSVEDTQDEDEEYIISIKYHWYYSRLTRYDRNFSIETNKRTCYFDFDSKYIWYYYDENDNYTEILPKDMPKLKFVPEAVYDQNGMQALLVMFNLTRNVKVSLEDKFDEIEEEINAPLKDKTYEEISQELVNGESYNFEEHFTLDSNEDRVIYDDSNAQTPGLVSYINVYNNHLWVDVVGEPGNISSPFGYNLLTNEWEDDSYQYLPAFIFNSNASSIVEEDLKIILGLESKKITLDEKLKYLITDYTEDNGALTSITVKDKTTGEPTVLTVGSPKKYQHICKITNSNFDAYVVIENEQSTQMTMADLAKYLNSKGFTSSSNAYPANGGQQYNSKLISYYKVYSDDVYAPTFAGRDADGADQFARQTYGTISDTVIPK